MPYITDESIEDIIASSPCWWKRCGQNTAETDKAISYRLTGQYEQDLFSPGVRVALKCDQGDQICHKSKG